MRKNCLCGFIFTFALIMCSVLFGRADAWAADAKGVLDTPYYETDFYKSDFNQTILSSAGSLAQGYGYFDDSICEYLQEEISTVSEVMAYLKMVHYRYDEREGIMGFVHDGWTNSCDPRMNIVNNYGVCCETSCVVAYLLADDYEEVGFVIVHGDYGHQYNYIKDYDGTYYLVDFTDYTSGATGNWNWNADDEETWLYWKDDICFWSGKSLDSKAAKNAALIHDTYEEGNGRTNLNKAWNNLHTAVIVAVPCMPGQYVPVPTMTDACYQSTMIRQGLEINGQKYYMTKFVWGIQAEVYPLCHVLFANNTTGFLGGKWSVVPIDRKYIPWYVADDIYEDDETVFERMLRQCGSWTYELASSVYDIDKDTQMVVGNCLYRAYGGGTDLKGLTAKQLKKQGLKKN